MGSTLAAIAWDPHIRGALTVVVGAAVFFGSVYLLLATNIGLRGGFMVAMAGLFGWCFIMGIFWWAYGIGLTGRAPSWTGQEINFDRGSPVVTEEVESLPPPEQLPDPVELLAQNPEIQERLLEQEGPDFEPTSLTQLITLAPELEDELDLGGWTLLSEADPRRGEAVASADAILIDQGVFTAPGEYIVEDVFFRGGKELGDAEAPGYDWNDRLWPRIQSLNPVNPPLFAVVTLNKAAEVELVPGEPPPTPEVDPEAESAISVVLLRDLGKERFVPAMFTLLSGALFALFCWGLHERDKKLERVRAEAGVD